MFRDFVNLICDALDRFLADWFYWILHTNGLYLLFTVLIVLFVVKCLRVAWRA